MSAGENLERLQNMQKVVAEQANLSECAIPTGIFGWLRIWLVKGGG